MSEQVLNTIITRIENMGYELGGEAVQLLQRYYPIVRRKILIANIGWLVFGLIILGIAIFLIKKAWESIEYEGAYTFFATIFILWSSYLIFSRIVTFLNLDYYTIESILDQLTNID